MEIRSGVARSGDLDIYYEDMGDRNDPAVLLIMGLGAQLLLWRNGFCEKLVQRGLRVIRYDNRDVGLSSKLDGQRVRGSQYSGMVRSFLGRPSPAIYTLEDMADDGAAVLDHLGVGNAHIVGASMGGMIAQVFAARHAARTVSLGVIFSSNNRAALPPPAPRALFSVIKGPRPGSPREVIIDNAVRVTRIIGSPALPGSRGPDPRRRGGSLRPQLLPRRHRPPVRRDPGQRQPAPLRPADHRTHRRHPRPGRQVDASRWWTGGRRDHPRRPAGVLPRHGP